MANCLRSIRIRHRLPAVVALIPLCAMAWILIYNLPVGWRTYYQLTSEATVEGNRVVRSEHLGGQPRYVEIDLEGSKSAVLRRGAGGWLFSAIDRVNSRGERIQLRHLPAGRGSEVRVSDTNGGVIVNELLSLEGYPTLVGDDFLVVTLFDKLEIRDLRKVDDVVYTQLEFPWSSGGVRGLTGSASFIKHCTTPAQEDVLELYEIRDSKACLLKRWTVEGSYGCHGDKIYIWKKGGDNAADRSKRGSQSGRTLECFDACGEFVETLDLPPPFESDAEDCRVLGAGVIFYLDAHRNVTRYFDLESRREIPLPIVCCRAIQSTHNESLVHFLGPYHWGQGRLECSDRWLTYDRDAGRLQSDIKLPGPCLSLAESASHNFLLPSLVHGYSIVEVSRSGDQVVRLHAPYAWAGWLMPLTSVVFVLWAVYWAASSIRDGGPAWGDCLLIGGFPLACIWLRGRAVEPGPLLLLYEIGIYWGMLAVGSGWLIAGRTPISRRVTAMAVIVSLGVNCGAADPWDESIEGPVIFSSLAAAIGMLTLGNIARLSGFEVCNKTNELPGDRAEKVTIACFFWAATAIALLATSANRIELPSTFSEWIIGVVIGSVSGLVMLVAAVLALCTRHRLFVCAGIVCGLVTLAAVAVPRSMFVYGNRPEHFVTNPGTMVPPIVLSIAFTTTFALLLPYRLRGWRFKRRRKLT